MVWIPQRVHETIAMTMMTTRDYVKPVLENVFSNVMTTLSEQKVKYETVVMNRMTDVKAKADALVAYVLPYQAYIPSALIQPFVSMNTNVQEKETSSVEVTVSA